MVRYSESVRAGGGSCAGSGITSSSGFTLRRVFYTVPSRLVGHRLGARNRHADLLFNIVSSRSQQNSTIITTNRPFAEWGEAFPNAACVVALVDRLVHNAEIVAIDGESWRRKEAEERQKQRSAERRRRRGAAGPPACRGGRHPGS